MNDQQQKTEEQEKDTRVLEQFKPKGSLFVAASITFILSALSASYFTFFFEMKILDFIYLIIYTLSFIVIFILIAIISHFYYQKTALHMKEYAAIQFLGVDIMNFIDRKGNKLIDYIGVFVSTFFAVSCLITPVFWSFSPVFIMITILFYLPIKYSKKV